MGKNNVSKLNILMTISLWVMGIGLLLFFLTKLISFAWPSISERNSFLFTIKFGIMRLFVEMVKGILSTYDYISRHYFKTGTIFLMIAYLLISFFAYPVGPLFKSGSFDFNTRTNNATFDTHSAFLLFTNIAWVLLGAALIFGSFNLTLSNWTRRFPYPGGGDLHSRLFWTIKRSFFDLKVFTGGIIVFALLLGILYLIGKFQILSLSLSILLQLFSAMALLFMVFQFVNSHPGLNRALEKNTILKLLYHLIFAIPCFVKFLTESVYKDAVGTPKTVWGGLLLEILVMIFYFIIPIIKNKFYTTNLSSRDNSLTIQQAEAGILSGISALDRGISSIKQQLNVDWRYIIKNKLYKSEKDEQLTTYLKSQHFKEHYEENKKLSSYLYRFFVPIPTMTLGAAKTFVQTNTTILMTKETDKKKLENEKDDFLKQSDAIFTSKILLQKPVYTDNIKVLGNFENLKGDLGEYNYQYGLSAWIYLHEQPPSKNFASTKFTSIINYGDKPNILFNPSKGILQITNKVGKNNTEIIYQTSHISLQKWNNIVINYEGGTLDVFLNGELVASKNNIIPYMSYDLVTSGSKDGISGGTCSIVYYSGPLSKRQIEFFYNSLKNKNPPLI